jgi:hypothetical protein
MVHICVNGTHKGAAASIMSSIGNAIKTLGTEIVNCRERCDGIKNDQSTGYYPRVFFLDPDDVSEVEVAIVGKNPGESSYLERQFYKALAERHENGVATYEDCVRVWNSLLEIEYFTRPKHLLKELGLPQKGLLWAEVVFCESDRREIPRRTCERCREHFLRRLLSEQLIHEEKYILCLGNYAFEKVTELAESLGNRWRIVGCHHPGSRGDFSRYFEKNDKKICERSLTKQAKESFRRSESRGTYPYMFEV